VKHRSILEYANFRWFKLALFLCAASAAVYIWHDPPLKPYGGTWLGYTLGTIGALLIFWLAYFGVRKRRYRSNVGSVAGWLSAHVYLGVALIWVATLHTGFELGWNVHTLAYVLMCLVVVSGTYGVFIYLRVPTEMTANAGEDTLASMMLRISEIDKDMREKALSLPDKLFAIVDKSVSGSRLGGSFARLISGRDRACPGEGPADARQGAHRRAGRRQQGGVHVAPPEERAAAALPPRHAQQGHPRPLALHPRAAVDRAARRVDGAHRVGLHLLVGAT
jgi:hypothetical protein